MSDAEVGDDGDDGDDVGDDDAMMAMMMLMMQFHVHQSTEIAEMCCRSPDPKTQI